MSNNCKKRVVVATLVLASGRSITATNEKVVDDDCSTGICMVDGKCRNTIHAEIRVLLMAVSENLNMAGSKLLVTKQPCLDCLKMAVYLGVTYIMYEKEGTDPVFQSPLYKRLLNCVIVKKNS